MNYEKIGHFISILRKEKGLTQKELAVKIGVTDKAISKWERGLGCPDVSLLENLSIALEVTILEILKGRYISKDEITNDDINDLVLETVNYSKKEINKKYKNIILNMLMVIIIIIVSFISMLNVLHISYLNKKEYFNFDNVQTEKINNNLAILGQKINLIKSSRMKYEEKDLKEIIKIFEDNIAKIKENPLLNYKGSQYFKLNDLYVIDNYPINTIFLVNGYNILEKYYKKITTYKEHFINTTMAKMLTSHDFYSEPRTVYTYKFNLLNNHEVSNYKILARVVNLNYIVEEMIIYSQNIIEVGAINE